MQNVPFYSINPIQNSSIFLWSLFDFLRFCSTTTSSFTTTATNNYDSNDGDEKNNNCSAEQIEPGLKIKLIWAMSLCSYLIIKRAIIDHFAADFIGIRICFPFLVAASVGDCETKKFWTNWIRRNFQTHNIYMPSRLLLSFLLSSVVIFIREFIF